MSRLVPPWKLSPRHSPSRRLLMRLSRSSAMPSGVRFVVTKRRHRPRRQADNHEVSSCALVLTDVPAFRPIPEIEYCTVVLNYASFLGSYTGIELHARTPGRSRADTGACSPTCTRTRGTQPATRYSPGRALYCTTVWKPRPEQAWQPSPWHMRHTQKGANGGGVGLCGVLRAGVIRVGFCNFVIMWQSLG